MNSACIRNLEVDRSSLRALCSRNRIRLLSLFGSVLRDDFHGSSDVDVLVEFEAGYTPGLEFFRIQRELSSLFGYPVDLRTPADLSPHIRSRIAESAEPLYVHR